MTPIPAPALAARVERAAKTCLDSINARFAAIVDTPGVVPVGASVGAKILAISNRPRFAPLADVKTAKASIAKVFAANADQIAECHQHAVALSGAADYLRGKAAVPPDGVDPLLRQDLVTVKQAASAGVVEGHVVRALADQLEQHSTKAMSDLAHIAQKNSQWKSAASVAANRQTWLLAQRVAKNVRSVDDSNRWLRAAELFKAKWESSRAGYAAAFEDKKSAARAAAKERGTIPPPSPFGQRGGKRVGR